MPENAYASLPGGTPLLTQSSGQRHKRFTRFIAHDTCVKCILHLTIKVPPSPIYAWVAKTNGCVIFDETHRVKDTYPCHCVSDYKGLVQVDVWDRELQRMLDKTYLDEARRVKIGFIQHELQFSISHNQPVPDPLSRSRKNTHFVTKSTRKCYRRAPS